jgi:hypothetical protein
MVDWSAYQFGKFRWPIFFWIKESFDGFLPNHSFVAKIMIQSINKSKETKREHI